MNRFLVLVLGLSQIFGATAHGASFNLVFVTSQQSLSAGTVSGLVTIQVQTPAGAPAPVAANTTVNLASSSPSMLFGATSAISPAVTGITILTGSSTASFYFKDLRAGSPTITATAAPGTITANPGNQTETIEAGTPSSLAFSSQPGNALIGATFLPVTVQLLDGFGNPAAQSGVSVALSLNNAMSDQLLGTTSQATDVNGIATFSDLSVQHKAAGNLSLKASGTGLNSATSASFNVVSAVNTSPPVLKLLVNGPNLVLQWPADHVGWGLETATNTAAFGEKTNWVSVAGSTLVDQSTNMINPTNGAVFYRLVYP